MSLLPLFILLSAGGLIRLVAAQSTSFNKIEIRAERAAPTTFVYTCALVSAAGTLPNDLKVPGVHLFCSSALLFNKCAWEHPKKLQASSCQQIKKTRSVEFRYTFDLRADSAWSSVVSACLCESGDKSTPSVRMPEYQPASTSRSKIRRTTVAAVSTWPATLHTSVLPVGPPQLTRAPEKPRETSGGQTDDKSFRSNQQSPPDSWIVGPLTKIQLLYVLCGLLGVSFIINFIFICCCALYKCYFKNLQRGGPVWPRWRLRCLCIDYRLNTAAVNGHYSQHHMSSLHTFRELEDNNTYTSFGHKMFGGTMPVSGAQIGQGGAGVFHMNGLAGGAMANRALEMPPGLSTSGYTNITSASASGGGGPDHLNQYYTNHKSGSKHQKRRNSSMLLLNARRSSATPNSNGSLQGTDQTSLHRYQSTYYRSNSALTSPGAAPMMPHSPTSPQTQQPKYHNFMPHGNSMSDVYAQPRAERIRENHAGCEDSRASGSINAAILAGSSPAGAAPAVASGAPGTSGAAGSTSTHAAATQHHHHLQHQKLMSHYSHLPLQPIFVQQQSHAPPQIQSASMAALTAQMPSGTGGSQRGVRLADGDTDSQCTNQSLLTNYIIATGGGPQAIPYTLSGGGVNATTNPTAGSVIVHPKSQSFASGNMTPVTQLHPSVAQHYIFAGQLNPEILQQIQQQQSHQPTPQTAMEATGNQTVSRNIVVLANEKPITTLPSENVMETKPATSTAEAVPNISPPEVAAATATEVISDTQIKLNNAENSSTHDTTPAFPPSAPARNPGTILIGHIQSTQSLPTTALQPAGIPVILANQPQSLTSISPSSQFVNLETKTIMELAPPPPEHS